MNPIRASLLHYYETSKLLELSEDNYSIELFKLDLSDPRVYIFLNKESSMMFILKPLCYGVYDLHFYTDGSTNLRQIREFCFKCCKEVKRVDPSFTHSINVVKKSGRHLKIMMHRLFKSKKLFVTDTGATVYRTDYKVVEDFK